MVWCVDLVSLWHVEPSQTRDGTHVPCMRRQIPVHHTTREVHSGCFEDKICPTRSMFLALWPFVPCSLNLIGPESCSKCGQVRSPKNDMVAKLRKKGFTEVTDSSVMTSCLSWNDFLRAPCSFEEKHRCLSRLASSEPGNRDTLRLDPTPSAFSYTTHLCNKCCGWHLYFHSVRGYVCQNTKSCW